jgi:hypothetical protein
MKIYLKSKKKKNYKYLFANIALFYVIFLKFESLSHSLNTVSKSKAVPLHAMEALGGEEV